MSDAADRSMIGPGPNPSRRDVLRGVVGLAALPPALALLGEPAAAEADELSSAWVAFAKTGDPNTPAIPSWPAYDAKTRATLIIDNETRVENDPNSQMRQLWEKVPG